MKTILLFLTALLTVPLVAAEKADLTLTDGRVLKAARVVVIGEEQATIVHAGGAISVPVDLVPLDVLARAHMEIEAKAKDRQKENADLVARAESRTKAAEEKKAEEIQLKLAAANARSAAQGAEQVQRPKGRMTPDTGTQLQALKAKFPANHLGKFSGSKGRFEFEAPPVDEWSYYKGMVQTTTIEALSRTLSMIENRLSQDMDSFSKRTGDMSHSPTSSEQAQARATLDWFKRELKPFLGQLRAVVVRQ